MALTEEGKPTAATALKLGLGNKQFRRLRDQLGRYPNFTELSVFSVLWAEDRIFANSAFQLSNLPRPEGRYTDRLNIYPEHELSLTIGTCLTTESHRLARETQNKISDLHRHLYAKGFSLLAGIPALQMGPSDKADDTRTLEERIIRSIGEQVHQLGIPSPECLFLFHPGFTGRPAASILTLGLSLSENDLSAATLQTGDSLFIAGALSRREGSFALNRESQDLAPPRSPDPHSEMLLMEAIREALEENLPRAVQPIGKGGLALAAAEMSIGKKTGLTLNLDEVPTDGGYLEPLDILHSESPARILIGARAEDGEKLEKIFLKWGLACQRIGEINAEESLKLLSGTELLAEVPYFSLIPAPIEGQHKKVRSSSFQEGTIALKDIPPPRNYPVIARRLCSSVLATHQRSRCSMLDGTVGTSALFPERGNEAALLRIKTSGQVVALTFESRPEYQQPAPHAAVSISVAEATRRLVCAGAKPIALASSFHCGEDSVGHCLQSVRGLQETAEKYSLPVIGEEMVFFNCKGPDNKLSSHYLIAAAGIMDGPGAIMQLGFRSLGDSIYMIGPPKDDLGGSRYLTLAAGGSFPSLPQLDFDEEALTQEHLLQIIRDGLIASACSLSRGGLFVALLQSALAGQTGIRIETDTNFRKDAYLFGESQSRVVVSVPPEKEDELVNYLNA
ncbi:MAG: AIR synthase-related protein, partial [Saprospiraceae bacterium]|nr:AIR synthase-related protein [Saprospiraceae bacterium]